MLTAAQNFTAAILTVQFPSRAIGVLHSPCALSRRGKTAACCNALINMPVSPDGERDRRGSLDSLGFLREEAPEDVQEGMLLPGSPTMPDRSMPTEAARAEKRLKQMYLVDLTAQENARRDPGGHLLRSSRTGRVCCGTGIDGGAAWGGARALDRGRHTRP